MWTLGRKISLVPAMNLILIPPHILISRYSCSDILNLTSSQIIIILRQSIQNGQICIWACFTHAVHITSTDDTSRDVFPIVWRSTDSSWILKLINGRVCYIVYLMTISKPQRLKEIINNVMRMLWKEVVMACFKVLTQNFPEGTETYCQDN